MLRSSFYSFTTALRGLNTAQKQLDVTGQNIANVGTYGYTRQRADIYSAAPGGYGDRYSSRNANQIGQGVIIGGISQSRDPFLDIRFRREAANLGEQGSKLDTMEDLSSIFDEIEKSGLMSGFNDFISKLQTLSRDPQSPELDSITRDSVNSLIKQFNQYASQLATTREEKEYNLSEVSVKSVNDLLGNIAALNKSIREVQTSGSPALELQDERNLLLDELSNYMKLDVKYSPKELAGGIVVDDITISIVGADGSKEPLIFNDTASKFDVKTPGTDGTGKAIVTIDNSALPANKTIGQINDLLSAISTGNASLYNLNEKLAKLYPGDSNAVPPVPPLNFGDLPNKITDIDNSINGAGGFNDQIVTANTALETAKQALADRLADTANPPTAAEKEALKTAVKDATDAKNNLMAQKTAAAAEHKKLSDFNKEATKHTTNLTALNASLNAKLAEHGITATQQMTPGDYSSCFYTFTDVGGNPINDPGGQRIRWNVGGNYSKVDRESLAQLGVVFNSTVDAEEHGSPGSLKGAIDMLNSKGVFDYESSPTRGIGYYENMLDSLANQLATTLNKLNDKDDTAVKEHLFQTSDGSSEFTAKNLRLADGWLNGKYGITVTKTPSMGSDNSGASENLLLMISTISSKLVYSTGPVTNRDKDGNYLKTDANGNTTIAANGRDKDGNYTLDGVLVCNKDMVNYKSVELTPIDADSYQDANGNIYSRRPNSTDNIFTFTDVNGVDTAVNSDGTVYKGDGTTGEFQLDAVTVSPSNNSFFGKLPDGTFGEIANGKDANGNYTMTSTDANGIVTTVTVANADGVQYKRNPDGTVVTDTNGNPVLDKVKLSPAFIGQRPDGTTGMVANGRDPYGNYTMTTTDANGKSTTVVVANEDGVQYRTEADGSISKDKEGNPILNAADSKLDYKPERFLHKGTFQEFLTNISNVISLDVSSTSNLVANHEAVLGNIQNSKDSISSVSLDEEGVNIMQFQKAYNAAARLMTALDEALERIINQMGTVGR